MLIGFSGGSIMMFRVLRAESPVSWHEQPGGAAFGALSGTAMSSSPTATPNCSPPKSEASAF